MRWRRPNVSRRAVANQLATWNTLANGAPLELKEAPVRKRGKQPEGEVNKANQQWARLKGGELRRNRQGFAEIRSGVKIPFGLGTGTLDLVGPMPVVITSAMVGKTIS